jgi:hypothetical protein
MTPFSADNRCTTKLLYNITDEHFDSYRIWNQTFIQKMACENFDSNGPIEIIAKLQSRLAQVTKHTPFHTELKAIWLYRLL